MLAVDTISGGTCSQQEDLLAIGICAATLPAYIMEGSLKLQDAAWSSTTPASLDTVKQAASVHLLKTAVRPAAGNALQPQSLGACSRLNSHEMRITTCSIPAS